MSSILNSMTVLARLEYQRLLPIESEWHALDYRSAPDAHSLGRWVWSASVVQSVPFILATAWSTSG